MSQIRQYIERAPQAVSGSGGHLTTLRVARSLFNGFGLDRQKTLEWLRVYNSRLSDKWNDRELEHKADSAARGTYEKPRGWMLNGSLAPPPKIAIRREKNTPEGIKKAKKYILATDATAISHTQSGGYARAHAHAQSRGQSKISVASVAKFSVEQLADGTQNPMKHP